MSSLLPAYEYDIFISYRHNDNRSGWVTDFVKASKDELAATVKEPLSIYFDSIVIKLKSIYVGCFISGIFTGIFMYADDIIL